MDRFTQFAVVAADEAIKDSGIDEANIDPYRIGVIVSSAAGGFDTFEKESFNFRFVFKSNTFQDFIRHILGNIINAYKIVIASSVSIFKAYATRSTMVPPKPHP